MIILNPILFNLILSDTLLLRGAVKGTKKVLQRPTYRNNMFKWDLNEYPIILGKVFIQDRIFNFKENLLPDYIVPNNYLQTTKRVFIRNFHHQSIL